MSSYEHNTTWNILIMKLYVTIIYFFSNGFVRVELYTIKYMGMFLLEI